MKRGQQVFCTDSNYNHEIITEWTGIYSDEERQFQGVASIESTLGNKLWAAWYGGGTTECAENYIMLTSSIDRGRTWKKHFIINSSVRCSEPNVWLDPTNTLWLSWGHYPNKLRGDNSVHYRMLCSDPDAENAVFTNPQPFSQEILFNKPNILSDGRWLLQGSVWRFTENSRPIYSDDEGKTFFYGADLVLTCPREFDEYMTVERSDGSIWLMTRVEEGLAEGVSNDRGETFSPVEPSRFKHITSRFYLCKLPSGRLLWIRHGYPYERLESRYNLMAFLSEDDGETWKGGLLIDRRVGVAYPDATYTQDGKIYVIYDFDRLGEKEILLAELTEERILSGGEIEKSELMLVNKAYGVNPNKE